MSTPEGAKISNKVAANIQKEAPVPLNEERNFIYSDNGEPSLLQYHESSNTDYGLQNAITAQNLACLLNAKQNNTVNAPNFLIVDCRYEKEYQAGHISSAININNDPNLLNEIFFAKSENIKQLLAQKTAIIFHCEFSEQRGPTMYSILRNIDR